MKLLSGALLLLLSSPLLAHPGHDGLAVAQANGWMLLPGLLLVAGLLAGLNRLAVRLRRR